MGRNGRVRGRGGLEDLKVLDPQAVTEARNEEIALMERIGVWEVTAMDECRMMTGKEPISTRRVDVDKGRDGAVDVRSRLVARDFKVRGDGWEFDVYTSMPPRKRSGFCSGWPPQAAPSEETPGRAQSS